MYLCSVSVKKVTVVLSAIVNGEKIRTYTARLNRRSWLNSQQNDTADDFSGVPRIRCLDEVLLVSRFTIWYGYVRWHGNIFHIHQRLNRNCKNQLEWLNENHQHIWEEINIRLSRLSDEKMTWIRWDKKTKQVDILIHRVNKKANTIFVRKMSNEHIDEFYHLRFLFLS